ncbi:MAG: Ig-like domain-containing protein [Patescibacteria group bacterium]|nr:Ig-like domain-containing protein [Patescibacteria group bacterium]
MTSIPDAVNTDTAHYSTENNKSGWYRSALFVIIVLAVAALGTALQLRSHATTARALLIKTGQDIPSPAIVNTNKAWIDGLPFDGIIVTLPGLDGGTFSTTSHTLAEYQSALSSMPTMTHSVHNFARVTFQQPATAYAWDTTANWDIMAANMGNLAKALAAKGQFDGIMIDPEFYGTGGSPWNYGTSSSPAWTFSTTAGATPGMQPAEAIAAAQDRGHRVMEAVKANWPSANVLTFHGPYVSEPKTGAALAGFYNDVAFVNEMMGPFEVGMMQSAAGSSITYHDGGELYGARTAADFQAAYNWQKTGLADSGTNIMPSSFASTYKSTVHASIGVYDKDILATGYPLLSTSTWQNLLTLAMEREDNYVWTYTETYDWMRSGSGKPAVPQAYIDATRAAVTAATPTSPIDSSAPTVTVSAPLNGTTVSGTTTVQANVSDNVGVTKTEFYVDGALAQSGTATAFSWNTTTKSNGSHTVQAKAYDAANNVGTSAADTVTVSNATPPPTGDTTVPVVSLTGVSNGQALSGSVVIGANASDNVGVTKVVFYLDGALTSTETTKPYCLANDNGTTCYAWNSTTVANGSHSFQAKAYDAAGNIGSSATLTVNINNSTTATADTLAPQVSISAPNDGSTVTRNVAISAQASDNIAATYIEIDIDGVLFASSNSDTIATTWSTQSKRVGSGLHTITVIARDDARNTGTKSIKVYK